jgi:NAD+ diphosphatase
VSYTTVNDPSSASDNPPKRISSIAFLSTPKVTPLLGPPPYFSQGAQPGSTTPPEPDKPDILHGHGKVLEAARIHGPRIVFLGVEEPAENASLPSSAFHNPEAAEDIKGTPYFALDVSDLEKESVDELLKVEGGADPVEFAEPRGASNLWNHFEAAVFSVARSMIDWNGRNKVDCRNALCLSLDILTVPISVLSSLWIEGIFIMGRMEVILLYTITVGKQ